VSAISGCAAGISLAGGGGRGAARAFAGENPEILMPGTIAGWAAGT
jgi:hypothetical protein